MRDNAFKTRENLARRRAARQGLTLRRSPRRDTQAIDYGLYSLMDAGDMGDPKFTLTIDQVEHQLDVGAEARRQQALQGIIKQAAAQSSGGKKRQMKTKK